MYFLKASERMQQHRSKGPPRAQLHRERPSRPGTAVGLRGAPLARGMEGIHQMAGNEDALGDGHGTAAARPPSRRKRKQCPTDQYHRPDATTQLPSESGTTRVEGSARPLPDEGGEQDTASRVASASPPKRQRPTEAAPQPQDQRHVDSPRSSSSTEGSDDPSMRHSPQGRKLRDVIAELVAVWDSPVR